MPLEPEKLQLELPVAARKAFHPPPAIVPRQPALRPVHFGAEERSSPQNYQPPAHRRDWPISRRKFDVVPQFSPPLFINPKALVHEADVDVKLPEHQTIGRVENNRFGFDNQDGNDIYKGEIRPRFISKAQLGYQAGKGGRTISDPLDKQNTGLYEEPRTIAMPSDMARAQREKQRLEMQPIHTVNSLILPIQQSNEVASKTGELMPHEAS
jgi:hypothetical protein